MNKLISKFAILTFGLFIILCFSQSNSAQNSRSEKIWTLTKINGEAVNTDKATISLKFEKNQVGGNGGCNSYGGTLVKTGNKIKISRIISTKMFCKEGLDVENKYLSTLEKVNKLKIAKGKLQLFIGKKSALEFAAKK